MYIVTNLKDAQVSIIKLKLSH